MIDTVSKIKRVEHIQTEPSDNWTIVHNLNQPAVITDVLIDGVITLPLAVNYIDNNTIEILFSRPRVGSVVII